MMNAQNDKYKKQGNDIVKRSYEFALGTIKLVNLIPKIQVAQL